MFEKETVFLTGAGASVHYGYPTGAEILVKVRSIANTLSGFYNAMANVGYGNMARYVHDRFTQENSVRQKYHAAADEVDDFIRRLDQVDPVVIDYFLGQNLHLERLGKLLIAWAILEVETGQKFIKGNYLRHIIHQIAIGCKSSEDLNKNKVRFLTFNYDTTLERKIRAALSGLSVFKISDIEEFCSSERFTHVYGAVNDGHSRVTDFSGVFVNIHSISGTLNRTIEVLDAAYEASKNLLVIDPGNKAVPENIRGDARAALFSAQNIVVIGFGFDKYNTELLGLQEIKNRRDFIEKIFVTNFNNVSRINQSIGRTFLPSEESLDANYAHISGSISIRKSILDADGALSQDFDLAF